MSDSEPLLTRSTGARTPPALKGVMVGLLVVFAGVLVRTPAIVSAALALFMLFFWLPGLFVPRAPRRSTLRFFEDHLELVADGGCHRVPWSAVSGFRELVHGVKVDAPFPRTIILERPATMRERRALERAIPDGVALELKPLGAQPWVAVSWMVLIALGALMWMVDLK